MAAPAFRHAILATIDYELFGSGAGDLETHLLQPTEQLLHFFAQRQIRATFFIEVAEILALQQAVEDGKAPSALQEGYARIQQQLKTLVASGHDVQLHYHPQWVGAVWRQDGWHLPTSHGGILHTGLQAFHQTVQHGKALLEEIAGEARPGYRCQVFRAGMYHLDRTPAVGAALLELGFRADSSVVRGYHRRDAVAEIDYRDLQDVREPYWRTLAGGPFAGQGDALLEFPVWSLFEPQWRKLSLHRLAQKWANRRANRPAGGEQAGRTGTASPLSLLRWLAARQANIWDFTLMTAPQLLRHYRRALRFHQPCAFFPLVMIGHTKELRSLAPLSRFHRFTRETNVPWIPFSSALEAAEAAGA